MSSTQVQGRLHGDPTQYANYSGASEEMYREGPPVYYVNSLPPDSEFAPSPEATAQKWPVALMLAGFGLVTAFLLAFLTLSMVRATDPIEATPSGAVTQSMTAAPAQDQQPRSNNRQPAALPTGNVQPSATTNPVKPQPPATMTNPLEPPPATMTNPLEPPPATMTNPLEPPPATMTNPLEPPPATMTNPLEPPVGSSYSGE